MIAKKIKILIKSDGSYLDTILPPITANEDGRTIVQVIAPFPITDIVSVNYSIRPIQATVKGSYLLPTGKFGKDVLDEDYTHFQTVADWNVFEIPINAVALEYISKYRAGLVLVSFTIKQLQTPYFATNYLGLFSDTNPIPTTTYNDGDYFIANEYNFTAHDITWAKGDYAYFYNGKWNKGKSVLKASTPSIELPVDPSLKDAPQLEYDEDVALLLANDLGLLTQRVSQSETDIESAENDINEIDGRVGVNETDIYNLESDVDDLETDIANMKSGVQVVKKAEQDQLGNVINTTYETKIDAISKKLEIDGRLNTAESDIDNLQFDVLENTGDITDLQTNKVPKTTKIIGLDLQDDILLTEFKTALGNATQIVAGLLSAEDKTHLDGLVALLESSDGNTVVDTIGEILAIFQNYPEGADLVTALNGKVDKVAGKGLSQNDFTDILKANLLSAYGHSQTVNLNPHQTTYQQLVNKPTTIEELGVTNVYNKQYIDALKDKNGWESELLGTLSNNGTIGLSVINQYDEIQMYAKDTLGVIDNENIRPSLMQSGDSVYFFDDTKAFIMVDTVFGFYAPAGYTLQVIGLKYTELKAVDVATSEVGVTVQDKLNEIDLDLEQKTDKLESRQVGTTQMSFVNGKLTSVVSDNVSTYIAYDQNGNIQKITETYADGKTYETTYTKDVEGRIKTMTKAEV